MEVDPDKQFLEEDDELVTPIDFTEEEETVVEPAKDLTEYGLVATMAKNGLVLLWEWKPLTEAREVAKKYFEGM